MLKTLHLQNFRNHKDFRLDLDRITIITGANGTGKSNILEALAMLAFCRSFRAAKKQQMINFESDFARLTADDAELFFGFTPQFTFKGKIRGLPQKLTGFVGFRPAVVLSPETLEIITGSPADRRRFLDIMMSQVDRDYLDALVSYGSIKQQRNSLLRRLKHREAQEPELNYWDGQLIQLAGIITTKRVETVEFLNQFLTGTYRRISAGEHSESTDGSGLIVRHIKNYDDLAADLSRYRSRDIAGERTNLGPHRDDLAFELNRRDMLKYASRGEIKSAILALKMAEMKFIEGKRKLNPSRYENTAPTLLLDDIFSEFDPVRRRHLSELLDEYQTVITTADIEGLPEGLLKKSKLVKLV